MNTSRIGLAGHAPVVGITRRARPPEPPFVEKARALLVGRVVTDVELDEDNLVLTLSDGGTFGMRCEGGFLEAG